MPVYNGLAVPEQLNIADYTVDCHVRAGRGDLVAIHYQDQRVTFAELQAAANRFGNALRGLGVVRGDHVLTLLPNRPETLVSILGAMKIGAVPVPVSTLYRARDLEAVVFNSDAVALVTSREHLAVIEEIRPRLPPFTRVLVDEIPKTLTGKIKRKELRDAEERAAAREGGSRSRGPGAGQTPTTRGRSR
ncbi:MAG: acyl-CoA synthetase [Candidatus Rokubacteria bacterium]|nr:acyl-CoA synthetase [Candidatus Rokubacteria bacterium]